MGSKLKDAFDFGENMTPEELRAFQRRGWKGDELGPCGEALLQEVRLGNGMSVLDAACGKGGLGLRAAQLVGTSGKVVGVDTDAAGVEAAGDAARRFSLPQFEVRTADARELPLGDSFFDAVVCQMAIVLIPEPYRAIKEFYRVLKGGGRVAISAWAAPKKGSVKPGALQGLLEAAGFREARELKLKGKPIRLASAVKP